MNTILLFVLVLAAETSEKPAIGAASTSTLGKFQLQYLATRTPMTCVTSSGARVAVKSLPSSATKLVLTTRTEQSIDVGEIDVGESDSSEKITTVEFKETFRVVRSGEQVWLLNPEEQRAFDGSATSTFIPWIQEKEESTIILVPIYLWMIGYLGNAIGTMKGEGWMPPLMAVMLMIVYFFWDHDTFAFKSVLTVSAVSVSFGMVRKWISNRKAG